MKTHAVMVRTRTAAQKLAYLRELMYQDAQVEPIFIPGPSQRADAQTKILSGPALRKAQEYLNLRHVVTPVVSTIRVIGLNQKVADSSAREEWEGGMGPTGNRQEGHMESVCPSQLSQENVSWESPCCDHLCGQEGRQEVSHVPMGKSEHESVPLVCRLRMSNRDQDTCNLLLQDYRCVVTRQEDMELEGHERRDMNACSLRPFVFKLSHA